MPKTITIQMVKDALNLEKGPKVEPGETISSELLDLFRKFDEKTVKNLIAPQNPKFSQQKPYILVYSCPQCHKEIEKMEFKPRGALLDCIFGKKEYRLGYISDAGEYSETVPGLERWAISGIFMFNGVCYSQIVSPYLYCRECRKAYAISQLPALQKEFELLKHFVEKREWCHSQKFGDNVIYRR